MSQLTRDVKVSRSTRSQDHFVGLGLGLGLTVIGLGLGLDHTKYWSRSHTLCSRDLKSILCSSGVMTSDCVPCSVNSRRVVSGHYEYFTSRKSSSSSIIHRLLFQIYDR